MKMMFLDESGDHSLTAIDPEYPVFVLGGIIVDAEYAQGELSDYVRQFKINHFGHDNIILHTADIARNRNGFEALADGQTRKSFVLALNTLMHDLRFTVVACVIKKDLHLSKYGIGAVDPYLLSLNILVERFCFEIGNVESGGRIIAERRNPTLDRQLELAWSGLRVAGTRYVRAVDINKRVSGLTLLSKKDNHAGLQLADLVVSPIGRHVAGKQGREDWNVIEQKFRRRDDSYMGAGLICLPAEDKK